MANFLISRTRRSSSRTRTIRRTKKKQSDSERSSAMGQCKKHPKHRQSPGVCSLCLNQKLSRLSTLDHASSSGAGPETASYCSSSDVSSSSSSYSSVSPCLSPLHHRYGEIVSKKKGGKKQGFLFRLLYS
ncbi:PREDICTED: uncharacterized protein LOC104800226 [Tarenaya hassleriana]|uniref:uncharacterized protein LOC104800226 n=1 Tax=Tarenaya hassleriana TaxID=28532 RepID=UPI00053C3C21|nr:PREDICTED: uncharacterized protein LOC104800226 [Tarenaya hassleriana]